MSAKGKSQTEVVTPVTVKARDLFMMTKKKMGHVINLTPKGRRAL